MEIDRLLERQHSRIIIVENNPPLAGLGVSRLIRCPSNLNNRYRMFVVSCWAKLLKKRPHFNIQERQMVRMRSSSVIVTSPENVVRGHNQEWAV